jgi:predicted membrane channel-forming protein YqfA (hemolysin III family)
MTKVYKWVFFILMSLVSIAAIVLTWVNPDPPSKLNMTVWIAIAMIWALGSTLRAKTEEK